MEVLIDAYNAMFAHPQIGPLVRRDNEAARREFLAFVAQNRPAGAERVFVVFDAHRDTAPTTETGRTRESYERGLHVVFATETADTWIQNRIRKSTDPRQITVVTSDREILATVEAHKAQVLRVSRFLRLRQRRSRRMTRQTPTAKPSHMSKRELARWEKLFSEHDEDDDVT
jgi:predicted RNA-binding protein with PIN domain